MQEVHSWMWRCFGSLWSEEAEEIAPPRESCIDQEHFQFLGLFKNVTPKSHKNSNLFFLSKEAVCTHLSFKDPLVLGFWHADKVCMTRCASNAHMGVRCFGSLW